jgi:hypothetical protein
MPRNSIYIKINLTLIIVWPTHCERMAAAGLLYDGPDSLREALGGAD